MDIPIASRFAVTAAPITAYNAFPTLKYLYLENKNNNSKKTPQVVRQAC